MILEITEKYRTDSEDEAENLIKKLKAEAAEKGYTVLKSGYTYKKKTAKKEIIAEAWIVSVTKEYHKLWEELD